MASKSTVSTTIQLLGKLDPSVSQAFDKAQSLASKAGSGIGKALSAGFKMAGTAAKAFGAAVAATTAYAIKLGTEYQSASGQIAAATGATGAELEGLQGVMQEVYGGNYGDSMEDVASAVATVKQQMQGLSTEDGSAWTSVILVLLSVLLTGVGIYPKLAKWGGAGALVPITGFANSVAAPAIEYKKEGQVFGIGCKIFTIAGPVILYGIFTSWGLGFVYWIWTLFR